MIRFFFQFIGYLSQFFFTLQMHWSSRCSDNSKPTQVPTCPRGVFIRSFHNDSVSFNVLAILRNKSESKAPNGLETIGQHFSGKLFITNVYIFIIPLLVTICISLKITNQNFVSSFRHKNAQTFPCLLDTALNCYPCRFPRTYPLLRL